MQKTLQENSKSLQQMKEEYEEKINKLQDKYDDVANKHKDSMSQATTLQQSHSEFSKKTLADLSTSSQEIAKLVIYILSIFSLFRKKKWQSFTMKKNK